MVDRRTLLPWIWIAALGMAACGGSVHRLRGSDEQFYYAQLLLERGKHLEAIEQFEQLRSAYPGSRYIDAAIYGLGRAHQEQGDYLVATAHYERIITDFPDSAHRPGARFQLGRCYDELSLPHGLDQDYSIHAIEQYALYELEYPDGRDLDQSRARLEALEARLAEKELEIGEFYLRRKRWEAALLYLDRVLEEYSSTRHVAHARLAKARGLAMLDREEEARALATDVLDETDDPGLRERAAQVLESLDEERPSPEAG